MLIKLMISRIVRSSTNLNLSSYGTQSALLFVWLKNSQFPSVAPWDQILVVFLFWKLFHEISPKFFGFGNNLSKVVIILALLHFL